MSEHIVKPKISERPTIVCLCGSTRFWRTFQQASLSETMAGRIVLSIGAASGTDDEHFGNLPRDEYDRVKAMLDQLHLRKVELADEILVLNLDGYVGESTARELAHARSLGKRVRFLEPTMSDEVLALRESTATLESQLQAAEVRAMILHAQLGGWEAACAAQVLAARAYIDAMLCMIHDSTQKEARRQLDLAIDSNAGELLLRQLQAAQAVVVAARRRVAQASMDADDRALLVALEAFEAAKAGTQ